MASGRSEGALAAQGSERPLGESTSTRDATEMKRRVSSPLGTGEIAVRSPSTGAVTSTPPPRPGTSKDCRKVYNSTEKFAGGTLGPTRAMIDVRKKRIRQNRTSKVQQLNSVKQEMEKVHTDVNQMFEELESSLLTHPAHPSVLVQTCSKEFNSKSVQLQQLQKQMSVLRNELQLIDQMLQRRNEPVLSGHQMNVSTTSKQLSKRESNIVPEVCGFPIYENPFDQLSNFESHTEGQKSEIIPVEVEERNEEELVLTDSVKRRTQEKQSDCSKVSISVAEPVISVQNMEDSVQLVQMQCMTEQATKLQRNVPDQNTVQDSNQSVQKVSSTVKSEQQSSIQSAYIDANRSIHANTIQSAHTGARESGYTAAVKSAHPGAEESVYTITEESAQTGASSSAHKGAGLQENIPLFMPTVELKPRSPPTFHGRFREDVSRWVSYMGNYLTFMQGTPDQQVRFAVTYIRGPALEWWDKYIKEYGYPNSWTVMSKALKSRFGMPFRAKEAQARIMNIRQGKRKIRDYSNEFLTLLNRLISYDESFMVNIYIWGLQPHFAKYVSAYSPGTVSEAIKIAEETEFSIWASQKDRLTTKSNGRQPNGYKKSKILKDNIQRKEQQQQQQHQCQSSVEDRVQQTTVMTSSTQGL